MARALSLILTGAALAGGCGGDDGGDQADGELRFTRPDGSSFTISEAEVQCLPGDTASGESPLTIYVFGPPGVLDDRGEEGSDEPFFRLQAIARDIPPKQTVQFPDDFYSDDRGVSLFVGDPGDTPPAPVDELLPDGGSNELSAAQEEAGGRIVLTKLSCSPRPEIAFDVDARLGSEFFEQPSIEVEGSFQATGDAE